MGDKKRKKQQQQQQQRREEGVGESSCLPPDELACEGARVASSEEAGRFEASSPHLNLDDEGLPIIPGLPAQEIKMGFRLFFLNKHKAADEFFDGYKDTILLMSQGKAAIMWLWALLSQEDDDIDAAIAQSQETHQFAVRVLGKLRPRSWFGTTASASNNDTLHCEVIAAQSTLLTATLQVLSGKITEKLKAGINIKSVVSKYKQFEKEAFGSTGAIRLKAQTLSMVRFGVGIFNLVTSILPPRIRKVAALLGFPANRAKGLKYLREAFLSDGVISPIAGLALMIHHTALQYCYNDWNYKFKKDAEEILEIAHTRYPDSGLFHMSRGRYLKLTRSLAESRDTFNHAITVQSEWKPLVDMGIYENAFISMCLFEWEEAVLLWKKLYDTNNWSKIFYAYMGGICYLAAGKHDHALELLQKISNEQVRELHGRQLPVDRFATRKIKEYVSGDAIRLLVPHLEVIFVWGGFHHMPEDKLKEALHEVKRARAARDPAKNPGGAGYLHDEKSVLDLIEGALYLQLGELNRAEKLLLAVTANKGKIKRETWLVPYAYYELTSIYRQRNTEDEDTSPHLHDCLSKAHGKHAHNFDTRLHFRVNLLKYETKNAKELEVGKFALDTVSMASLHLNDSGPSSPSKSMTMAMEEEEHHNQDDDDDNSDGDGEAGIHDEASSDSKGQVIASNGTKGVGQHQHTTIRSNKTSSRDNRENMRSMRVHDDGSSSDISTDAPSSWQHQQSAGPAFSQEASSTSASYRQNSSMMADWWVGVGDKAAKTSL